MLIGGADRSIAALARLAAAIVASLAIASALVAALEAPAGITDASLVYIVPVALIATRYGTRAGLIVSIGSFLVYDYFFTLPRFSLVVADPREWLELVLFLFVAIVIGQLSAVGAVRAALAERRAVEAEAQFAVSRQLARSDLETAVPAIVERIAADAGLARCWVTLEGQPGGHRLADTESAAPLPGTGSLDVLVRAPGPEPSHWIRAHAPAAGPRPPAGANRLRVRIEAEGETLGSLWAIHPDGRPGPEATRLLAHAADQVGLALHREQLRRAAVDAEVSRRSDSLKSALLRSVSHDLRTPLAGIRAAAGSLLDPAAPRDPTATAAAAAAIDAAAARLDRLVRGLLDLGRIESGLLRPDIEPFDLRALVDDAIARLGTTLGDRPVTIDVPDDLPPIRVDGVLFDEVLANLLENVGRHAPPPAACRIGAALGGDGRVELVIEDGGPGVDDAAAARLFAGFGRAEGSAPDRGSAGVGLAVVHGFAEAMGIELEARRSDLGGLAVVLRVPAADRPPAEAVA